MKRIFTPLLLALTALCALTACDNDADDSPQAISATYSNRLADGDDANLTLTYSGMPLIGKQARLETHDAQRATLTLAAILPHEATTALTDVNLTPADGGGYRFEGDAAGTTGTTFHYAGTVRKGSLTLDLSAVTLPANRLTSVGVWSVSRSGSGHLLLVPAAGNQNAQLLATAGNLIGPGLLSNLFATVLRRVRFTADGNITADYAPLPEGFNFSALMGGGTASRPESDYRTSPLNLATAFVAGDSLLYLTPQIDMIIRQARTAQTKTSPRPSPLETLYALLNTWSTTGVPLHLRQSDGGNTAGTCLVYLDRSEIAAFLPLLEMARQLLPADTLQMPLTELLGKLGVSLPTDNPLIGSLLGSMTLDQLLTMLADGLDHMERIEVGLLLTPENT